MEELIKIIIKIIWSWSLHHLTCEDMLTISHDTLAISDDILAMRKVKYMELQPLASYTHDIMA